MRNSFTHSAFALLLLVALLPTLLHAQRGTVFIPPGCEITIIAGAQLCADTILAAGALTVADPSCICGPLVDVEATPTDLTESSLLLPPFPNPALDEIVIPVELGQKCAVRLTVYDALGREITCVARGETLAAGRHAMRVHLDGCSSGIYLIEMIAGAKKLTRMVTISR
jgi:hypothetical protein